MLTGPNLEITRVNAWIARSIVYQSACAMGMYTIAITYLDIILQGVV